MSDAPTFQEFSDDDGLVSDDSEDDGEDDDDCPTVRVPKREKSRIRRAWASALIFRTLGKAFPYAFVVRRIQQLWARKAMVQVWDIGFDHYFAKFMSMEDYDNALNGGPWLIGDHYVVSEAWRPYFTPGSSPVNKLRVWVRLPNLPLECFDESILTLIGNSIGKTVLIDHTTLNGCRGNYARICIEVDISRKLRSKYRLWRRVRRVEYEGLHVICFECGVYGHNKEECPSVSQENVESAPQAEGAVFNNPMFQPGSLDFPRPELEEDYGAWMLAKKNVRRKPKNVGEASVQKAASPKQDSNPFSVLAEDVSTHTAAPVGETGHKDGTSDWNKEVNKKGTTSTTTDRGKLSAKESSSTKDFSSQQGARSSAGASHRTKSSSAKQVPEKKKGKSSGKSTVKKPGGTEDIGDTSLASSQNQDSRNVGGDQIVGGHGEMILPGGKPAMKKLILEVPGWIQSSDLLRSTRSFISHPFICLLCFHGTVVVQATKNF
ncbi:hypothetical protein LINPERHAP2_LOCUS10946 [Linum perenne]